MMQDTLVRPPAEPSHRQSVRHDVSRHARLERPANDFTIEQIQNDGQVQSPLVGPEMRNVRRPYLIRCIRRKISHQQILGHRQAMFRVGGTRLTASSLNSVVYAGFGMFFIFSSSKVSLFYGTDRRLNFRGSSFPEPPLTEALIAPRAPSPRLDASYMHNHAIREMA